MSEQIQQGNLVRYSGSREGHRYVLPTQRSLLHSSPKQHLQGAGAAGPPAAETTSPRQWMLSPDSFDKSPHAHLVTYAQHRRHLGLGHGGALGEGGEPTTPVTHEGVGEGTEMLLRLQEQLADPFAAHLMLLPDTSEGLPVCAILDHAT
ncbi:hypothetical protein [Streptomyces kurssanovii]|uniref:Uncharacterized protein n=1 Tax=Streptomyces kurssanovii TaxID=67312 RepID=A0ABV3HTL1_9ACTN